MPENFELVGGLKNSNMIAQSVPVCTAKFISEQAIKFLRGELEETDLEYAKFDNWNEKVENRGLISVDIVVINVYNDT